MKRKIFDTRVAVRTGLLQHAPRVLNYVVTNQHTILSETDLIGLIQPIRTILKSPMAECFDRLMITNAINNFAVMHIPAKDSAVPELLATPVIICDLKQFPSSSALSSLPNLRDKVILNVTNTLRKERDGGFRVDAIDNFQSMFVKGQIVIAYEDSDHWLNPYAAEFCLKSYSIILSGLISRYYNLSLIDTWKVRSILALFFAQRLTSDAPSANPPYYNRCTWGELTQRELTQIADECTEICPNGIELDDLCRLLATQVSDKMSKFDAQAFFQICGNLGSDLLTSQIGIEYPPFWIYMLIQALSGTKSMLVYQLNQQRLVTEGRSKFLAALIRDAGLFEVLR